MLRLIPGLLSRARTSETVVRFTQRHLHVVTQKELSYVIKKLEELDLSGDEDWSNIGKSLFSEKSVSRADYLIGEALASHNTSDKLRRRQLVESFIKYFRSTHDLKSSPYVCAQYICLLVASNNPVHRTEIDALFNWLIENKPNLRYDLIVTTFTMYASLSKETCLFVMNYLNQNNVRWMEGLIVQALKFELFNEIMPNITKPCSQFMLKTWIQALNKPSVDVDHVHASLNQMAKSRTSVPVELESEVNEMMARVGFTPKSACVVASSGACALCGTKLGIVTAEEVATLRSVFEEKVVKSFHESGKIHTKELQNIHNLFECHQGHHFDIVVDLLNLGFGIKKVTYRPSRVDGRFLEPYKKTIDVDKHAARILEESVVKRHRKVLVVTRKHTKRWPSVQTILAKYSSKIFQFSVRNDTEDDPIFIYAALQSHKTYLLTNDFLRQHTHLLGNYEPLFLKWKECRQVYAKSHNLVYPDNVELRVNVGDQIHIPFVKKNELDFLDVKWSCYNREKH